MRVEIDDKITFDDNNENHRVAVRGGNHGLTIDVYRDGTILAAVSISDAEVLMAFRTLLSRLTDRQARARRGGRVACGQKS